MQTTDKQNGCGSVTQRSQSPDLVYMMRQPGSRLCRVNLGVTYSAGTGYLLPPLPGEPAQLPPSYHPLAIAQLLPIGPVSW